MFKIRNIIIRAVVTALVGVVVQRTLNAFLNEDK